MTLIQKSPKKIYIRAFEFVHVTSVTLNKDFIVLRTVGQTEQLTATIAPANADDQAVTWTSSDPTVATVSNTGLVTCVTPGECTITVTTHDGSLTATCDVAGNGLPSYFQEVEYIQNTNAQYIDTLYRGGYNIKSEIKISGWTQSGSYQVLGADNGWRSGSYNIGAGWYCFGTGAGAEGYFEPCPYTDGATHEIEFSKDGFYVDGTLEATPAYSNNFNTSYTLYLFADHRYSGTTTVERGLAKVYYLKLYNNNVLVRHFVPCYKISNNVIGMYELVEGGFYTNKGSGTFTKGPDVN